MKTLLLAGLLLLGAGAATRAQTQGPVSFAGRILYSRTSPIAGSTVWVNDGTGTDQQLTPGFAPKPSPNGRYLLLLKNTPPADPFWSGQWVRRRAGSATETVVFASSDYLVGHDYFTADSSVVVSYTCGLYHNTFANAAINTLPSVDCYDDGPDIRQADSLVAFHNAQQSLFTVKLNGRQRRAIPNTTPFDSWPAWSPDGQWVLFGRAQPTAPVAERTLRIVNFYKIHPDGTGLTQLTPYPATDSARFAPGGDWSPNGQAIIVGGSIAGRTGLWALRPEGNGAPVPVPTTAVPGTRISFVGSGANVVLPTAVAAGAVLAGQLYPNPAAEQVQLVFWLARPASVQVQLLDALGRPAAGAAAARTYPAGRQQLTVAVAGLAPGVYQCRVAAGPSTAHYRLLVQH